MRISKQPSGGRGEYEIAGGLPDDISIEDLIDRALELEFGGLRLKTGVELKEQGGKRRLRIMAGGIHAHRQVAALLLLPRPRREESKTAVGEPVINHMGYVLETIATEDLELVGDNRFRSRVVSLACENQDHQGPDARTVDVDQRLADLDHLFSHRHAFDSELATLFERHLAQIETGAPLQRESERLVRDVVERTNAEANAAGVGYNGGDPVPCLLDILESQGLGREGADLDELERKDPEIRKRTVKNVRKAASRGASAEEFREDVNEVYDSRCLICGARYPTTDYNATGVEAAHILPWSEYELDEVHNGVALCKLHHWAFGEGLLVLKYDDEDGYYVEVPNKAEEALEDHDFTWDDLRAVEGSIPEERLPSDLDQRPHPDLLERLSDLVVD